MNYKHMLRLIGRAIAFGCLLSWLIIFNTALLISNNRTVQITLNANKLNEFWFEYILLIVATIGWLYDYYVGKRLEETKTDRKEDVELEETPIK